MAAPLQFGMRDIQSAPSRRRLGPSSPSDSVGVSIEGQREKALQALNPNTSVPAAYTTSVSGGRFDAGRSSRSISSARSVAQRPSSHRIRFKDLTPPPSGQEKRPERDREAGSSNSAQEQTPPVSPLYGQSHPIRGLLSKFGSTRCELTAGPRRKLPTGAQMIPNGLLGSTSRLPEPSRRASMDSSDDTLQRTLSDMVNAAFYQRPLTASVDGRRLAFQGMSKSLVEQSCRQRPHSSWSGWEAHKPRLSAIPPKCSQRNLSQPVLESGEKLRRMAERKHKRNTSELTAQEKSDRAKARWKFATTEVKQMIRDARTMAYQVLKSEIDTENAANQVIFSRHGDYLIIGNGAQKVKLSQLKQAAEAFDAMNPDIDGLVPYSCLMKSMQGDGPSQGNAKIMSRPTSHRQRMDPDSSARAANQVFNFQDMLKFQFPAATYKDIERMVNVVSPEKQPMNRMSQDKVLEAVTLFKRMDPQDTGKADYDSLEEVLNQEYPRANVYKLIKTMNSEMQEKLFSGEKISLQEFILWFGGLLSSDIKPNEEERTKNRGRKLQLKTPHEALAEYVASYPSRVHMQERFMDETMKYAEVERRSMRPGLGRDFPMNWAVDA